MFMLIFLVYYIRMSATYICIDLVPGNFIIMRITNNIIIFFEVSTWLSLGSSVYAFSSLLFLHDPVIDRNLAVIVVTTTLFSACFCIIVLEYIGAIFLNPFHITISCVVHFICFSFPLQEYSGISYISNFQGHVYHILYLVHFHHV